MGVDYRATAGYGVRVKDNLTEKGEEILEEEYSGDLYEFIDTELEEFQYNYIGCGYSGTDEPILLLDDPLESGNLDKFNKFKSDLVKYKHLLVDVEPKWFCELYIY